ncbi:ImmA/IrrE family metallo-endopeptidase [Methanosphaera sp. BMS]|uniref:ImmA/IrrE family metallo-endopeptidase n=1 Tax=Methanosphaera sp. BMS TaxID=1789762 RepID=UPI000DC1DFD5|nr:ImmA/IrrE family metallo-endopeptidase [Methanosphaera sp. BMS]AWX32007.1 toxin-antitoxin system toxin subunit [Methanosphaera sp. BMS]
MNSSALAEMLRHEWGIESFASVNIRSLVYNNIRNLTVLWFPMKNNISGCCAKTKDDKVIFINSNNTIGRQNFTLAHELYHLLYEDAPDYIGCGVNSNNQSEKNADDFASTFLMPDSALFWFKNKNQIEDWTLEDVIKCEQYYQISRLTMIIRLKNLNWISQNQFDEFSHDVIREADRLGYDTSLYRSSPDNQKYSSIGELIRLTQKAYDDKKITGGKRREILLNSFRNDVLYEGANDLE